MDNFIQELILAYFKVKKSQYSFREIAEHLGISLNATTECIQTLISQDELEYADSLLRLTLKGRTRIQNSAVDYLTFDQAEANYQISDVDMNEAWPIDQVYIPKRFSRKV